MIENADKRVSLRQRRVGNQFVDLGFMGFFVLLVALRRASGSKSSPLFILRNEKGRVRNRRGPEARNSFQGRVSAVLPRRRETDRMRGSSRAVHAANESSLSSHV